MRSGNPSRRSSPRRRGVGLEAGRLHLRDVTPGPGARLQPVVGAGEMQDAPMAEVDQVSRRQPATLDLVDRQPVGGVDPRRVQGDAGDADGDVLEDRGHPTVRRDDHQALDRLAQQPRDALADARVVGEVDVGGGDPIARRPSRDLDGVGAGDGPNSVNAEDPDGAGRRVARAAWSSPPDDQRTCVTSNCIAGWA